MEIYLYARCSSCRYAERILVDAGAPFQRRDFFHQPFTRDELASLLERTGLSPKDVLSRRSRVYTELDLGAKDLTDDDLIALMIQEPTLLRRPLIVAGESTLVGFDRERLTALVARS